MRRALLASLLLSSLVLAGCASGDGADPPAGDDAAQGPQGPVPHVIVGVPDSGINPYHELYYRPQLTMHPSVYIQDYPAEVPALNLTVGPGPLNWTQRFEQDKALWEAIEPGDVFWIPRTLFVAVVCESLYGSAGLCILDDTNMHGTGTTSSVVTENPDVLIAFKEGGSAIDPIFEAGIPVDIYSVSWGYIAPIPVQAEGVLDNTLGPIYVKAAGNDPRPLASDAWAANPRSISVGGAYAAQYSQEPLAANQPDVVSYFCRPTAQTQSLNETRESYCGTSFAAPTVAGALSKVVLALRQQSGHTGTLEGDFVDPILGVSIADLRAALNLTATYEPQAQYPNTGTPSIPLNPVAPWLQWGWGFYDGAVANATIAHLLGTTPAPAKPMEATLYMQTHHAVRDTVHGG